MFGKNSKQEITISTKTVVRVLAIITLFLVFVKIAENMVHPLTLIFVSFFLALALNQAVNWISRRLKIKSRMAATAISYVFVISILVFFMSLVVPPLVTQTQDFIKDIPSTVSDLQDNEGAIGDFVRNLNLQDQLDALAADWSSVLSRAQGPVVSIANRVVSNIISILTVLVLTFMMLVEGPAWLSAFWKNYPAKRREHDKVIAAKMYAIVKNYVNGQVVVAAIGAAFAILALLIATSVFNVSTINAIALGGIVFMFSLIPTIGATLSAVVVVLFCLFASTPLAITMLIYFVIYQQVENVSIQPLIQAKGNSLTPMLVFIAAILGIGFGGVIGAFVAIPLAGCIRVLIDDYLDNKSPDPDES